MVILESLQYASESGAHVYNLSAPLPTVTRNSPAVLPIPRIPSPPLELSISCPMGQTLPPDWTRCPSGSSKVNPLEVGLDNPNVSVSHSYSSRCEFPMLCVASVHPAMSIAIYLICRHIPRSCHPIPRLGAYIHH